MKKFDNMNDALNEVKKVLNNIENKTLPKSFNDVVLKVVAEAKKNCPVDQGPLRANIDYDIKETRDFINAKVGNNLEYAPYVHQGTGRYAVNGDGRKTPWVYTVKSGKYKGTHVTVGQKPQPYLLETMKKVKKTLPQDLAKAIKGGIK